MAVDVRPAHLCATNHRIGEEVDQLAQAIGLGNEVGVEDREQFALGRLVAVFECAGFEAGAIRAMDVVNIETLLPHTSRLQLPQLCTVSSVESSRT